jgi:choline dehydrogenase-like flavoprotein
MIIVNAGADIPSDTDVCIAGAGPIGLALAFKCAKAGLSVLLVDAGSSEGHSRAQTGLGPVEIVTPHHVDPEVATAQGIGGTSRLWGGRCVELDDIDFEQRDHVPFSGWPISHGEAARYYDEALSFLGCKAGRYSPDAPRETESAVTSAMLERWSAEPDLNRLHGDRLRKDRNIRVYTGCTVAGIRLDSDGSRVSAFDVRSGGRPFDIKAKNFVLACGGLENARLLLAAQRDWADKFGGPNGALGRFYCGHLTGYLAAIRFNEQSFARSLWYQRNRDGTHQRRRLALSEDAQRRHGLLNGVFWLDSFSVADPAHGSGALSMLYVGLALLGLYPRLGTGLAPSPTEPQSRGLRPHLSNVRRDPRLVAGTLHVIAQLVRKRFGQKMFALFNPGNRYLLRYHAEQVPNPDSRVVLGDEHHGEVPPPIKVDFRYRLQDIESIVKSHELLDNWLRTQNIGRLEFLTEPEKRNEAVLSQALDGYHQIGLTRMSNDMKDGVVDRNCRVHGVSNLFVAGSSVFPTAGQANPTLPAVALALRLGDYLCAAAATVRTV